jgi:hypothetical protein
MLHYDQKVDIHAIHACMYTYACNAYMYACIYAHINAACHYDRHAQEKAATSWTAATFFQEISGQKM